MTRVINIKDAPRGWETNPLYVYIGRAGKGQDGYFGNNHPINGSCPKCSDPRKKKFVYHKRGESIPFFERDFYARIANDPEFKNRVMGLKDKILVCFCKPNPCHGDVYANYLNNL